MPRALIFGMKHHLGDLYQVCSNYAPGAGPRARGHMFYIGLYRENIGRGPLGDVTYQISRL